MKPSLDPKYRKLAWEVARDSIVTKALARLLEQTVETIVTKYDHQRVTLEGEFLKLQERNARLVAALEAARLVLEELGDNGFAANALDKVNEALAR